MGVALSMDAAAPAWCGPAASSPSRLTAPQVVSSRRIAAAGGSFERLWRVVGLASGVGIYRQRKLRSVLRAEPEAEFVQGTSIFADAEKDPFPSGMNPLDLLPNMDMTEEEKEVREPSEPAMVLEVRGDLVVVRAGKGLFSQDSPGTIACTDSGADAVLLAWKEDIAILQLLAGEAEPGDETRRVEQKFLQTKCSKDLRGRILDPQGRPLDGLPMPEEVEMRNIFVMPKPKQVRSNQYRALFTGVQGIDFDVPIGRGQTMLFQGTDPEKDRKYLWPDLLASKPVMGSQKDLFVNAVEESEFSRLVKEERTGPGWKHSRQKLPRLTVVG